MSGVAWMIWRCRLESDTMSSSATPSVPTPAAARYISAGAPRPPAPITSTDASFNAAWPGPPTSRRTIWRAYRSSSSALSMARPLTLWHRSYPARRSWSGQCSLNHCIPVTDQADVLSCALFNGPETCHEIDADGNIDIRGRGGFRPGPDDGAVHGGRQAEAGRDHSDPPRLADPRRYCQCDGAGDRKSVV